MNSRATFESSHAGRIGAYAAGADGMSRSKSASAPAAVILDPRAKLYLLLLANMLLFFHADARAEALLTALFLTPLFLAGRWRMGLRLTACYAVLLGLGLLSDAATLDTAGASGAASASGSGADAWIHVVGLFSVGLRMMMPCFITGAYAFSTTRVSEFVCALRRMRVPESVAIPCMVVIRFFPTIGRDYRRTRGATRRDQAVAISAPGRRETDRFDPTIAFGVPKLHEPMRHKRCDDIVDHLPRQQRVLADRPLRRPIMVLEVVQNAHHIIRHSGSASVIRIRHVNAMQFIEEQIDMTRDR